MEPRALYALPPDELAELIRPAGYFQVKARRLRNLLKFVVDEHDGSLEQMFRTDVATLREALLAIHGIGPETADAILLYAGGLATFVVDTRTACWPGMAGSATKPTTTRSRTTLNRPCLPTRRFTMSIMRSWCAWARTIAGGRRRSATPAHSPVCCRKVES
jgi:endonuclease III